jgi:hypothetical protein
VGGCGGWWGFAGVGGLMDWAEGDVDDVGEQWFVWGKIAQRV